jgi:hypothetical protein
VSENIDAESLAKQVDVRVAKFNVSQFIKSTAEYLTPKAIGTIHIISAFILSGYYILSGPAHFL